MNSKYKIVVIISLLLVLLSLSITSINYVMFLNNTQKQLKEQSLPLSLDNIYTEIQKHIIQPYLVSSLMANDTFVQNWILKEEKNIGEIEHYLHTIKNKYSMFTTFLVSEKTGNYYTQDGYIEKINKTKQNNRWYYEFKKKPTIHEINLDFNQYISTKSLIMFINYKIYDHQKNFLGITGVGLKISYIDEMLKNFREKHQFKVFFVDDRGKIVLSEKETIPYKNINESSYLSKYIDRLISKKTTAITYHEKDETILLNTKYIPELNLHLIVEVTLSDFTKDAKKIFYINLFSSLFVSFIVILITIYLIKNYNKKLEYLAGTDQLTKINNRRTLEEKIEFHLNLQKRNKKGISFAFIDVDDFKKINDTSGHAIGDKVLTRIAQVLKNNIRKTDVLGRWGGEEFVIMFLESNKESSIIVTEKLRTAIENDSLLKDLSGKKITTSVGFTYAKANDSIDDVIIRADNAMYKAKESGKNKVIVV